MIIKKPEIVRVGFIRLLDAAPLIIGGELGIFRKAGVHVELRRQLGWAALEHKLVINELDAAQTLGPLPLAVNASVAEARGSLMAPIAMSFRGNAITLSANLRKRGVESSEDFSREVRSRRMARKYTLGYVAPYSSHHFFLRTWLRETGINPDKDVSLVVVPPGQVLRTLRAGVLDGFCVGEPWNSMASAEGIGWCPVWSHELAPDHVEKVVAFPSDWLRANLDIARAFGDALVHACDFCSSNANLPEIASILSRRGYLDTPASRLEAAFNGLAGAETSTNLREPTIIFRRNDCGNGFTPNDYRWLTECVISCSQGAASADELLDLARQTYTWP